MKVGVVVGEKCWQHFISTDDLHHTSVVEKVGKIVEAIYLKYCVLIA